MLAMWANMLFWAFLLTTLVYLCVGVACAVSMRLIKKGVSVGIALFFLLYAELRVICGDAIACEYTHTHTTHTHLYASKYNIHALFTVMLNEP